MLIEFVELSHHQHFWWFSIHIYRNNRWKHHTNINMKIINHRQKRSCQSSGTRFVPYSECQSFSDHYELVYRRVRQSVASGQSCHIHLFTKKYDLYSNTREYTWIRIKNHRQTTGNLMRTARKNRPYWDTKISCLLENISPVLQWNHL